MKQSAMLHFKEEEVILKQGSTQQEMYKILSGKAAVYFNHGQPDEYLIGILSEQRCFGELSILCGKPSVYTVVAFEDMLVLRITADTFDEFIRNNPQNAISIMKNLANTIDTLSMNLNMMGEDLATLSNAKDNTQKMQDITLRVRRYAALDSIGKAMFSASV